MFLSFALKGAKNPVPARNPSFDTFTSGLFSIMTAEPRGDERAAATIGSRAPDPPGWEPALEFVTELEETTRAAPLLRAKMLPDTGAVKPHLPSQVCHNRSTRSSSALPTEVRILPPH